MKRVRRRITGSMVAGCLVALAAFGSTPLLAQSLSSTADSRERLGWGFRSFRGQQLRPSAVFAPAAAATVLRVCAGVSVRAFFAASRYSSFQPGGEL